MSAFTSDSLQKQRSETLASLKNEEEKKAYEKEFPGHVFFPTLFYRISVSDHSEFASSRQQDAEEYLRYLFHTLSCISEKHPLPLAKDICDVLLKCFTFSIEERLHCLYSPRCVRLTELNEVILSLPLQQSCNSLVQPTDNSVDSPIDGSSESKTFHDCWMDWMREEDVTIYKKRNGEMEPVKAMKKRKIKTFPRFLIIQLGRFYFADDWTAKKIKDPVKIPMVFDITEYRATGLSADETLMQSNDDMEEEEMEPKRRRNTEDSANPNHVPANGIIQELITMGFPDHSAREALKSLGSTATLEQCIDWICSHDEVLLLSPCNHCSDTSEKIQTSDEETCSKFLQSMGFTDLQVTAALHLYPTDKQQALEWLVTVGGLLTEEEINQHVLSYSETVQRKDVKPKKPCPKVFSADDAPKGKYRLLGFASHKGENTNAGHYVFYAASSTKDSSQHPFVCFDDKRVTESSSDCVDSGYLYLYQRCDD